MGYYIEHNQQSLGPYEDYELLANGVTPQTLVWKRGMAKWQPAGQLPELAHLFPSEPFTQPQYGQETPPPFTQATPPPLPPQSPPPFHAYESANQHDPSTADDKKDVNFGDAISICFRKYVDFSGRARRSEFWYWTLFATLLNWFTGIGWIITLLPSLAVGSRRLHDTGRSGWWLLLLIIPHLAIAGVLFSLVEHAINDQYTSSMLYSFISSFAISSLLYVVCLIVIIVFWAQDSERGDNEYGKSVKY